MSAVAPSPARSAIGRRTAFAITPLLAIASLVACNVRRALRPEPATDPVATAWAVTLDSARANIAGGRGPRADSVLTAFRQRYGGGPQSEEALYWRALARTDLPAPPGGVRPAIADLDAYRTLPGAAHVAEAVVLRRTLAQLDSVRAVTVVVDRPAAAGAAISRSGLVPRDSLRVRDEELQRARADAAAAQAELDRVRRRLAAPGRRP